MIKKNDNKLGTEKYIIIWMIWDKKENAFYFFYLQSFIGYCLHEQQVFKLRGNSTFFLYGYTSRFFNPHSIGATLTLMTSLLIVPQVDKKWWCKVFFVFTTKWYNLHCKIIEKYKHDVDNFKWLHWLERYHVLTFQNNCQTHVMMVYKLTEPIAYLCKTSDLTDNSKLK